MKYDFTTLADRNGTGSVKWIEMMAANPNTPGDVVPFSVADMEFKQAPELTAALLEFTKDLIIGYTIPTGAYFDAVRLWMKKRHSWNVEEDWIICSEGVIPGFYNAIAACTRPGDAVIIMPPVYPPFFQAVEANKCRIEANTLIVKNGRYEINFEDLAKKAKKPETRALLFCSPHNPVGRVWTKEELERVAEICLENELVLISDEIHFDLVMPGFHHQIAAAMGEDIANNAITLTAPSKTFNIAGLHGANVIIKNEGLRKRYLDALSTKNAHPGLNIFAYHACETAYTRCEAWLDELLKILDNNKKLAEAFMQNRIPAIKVFPLEGTYLQWWDCRALGMNNKELEHFMTHEAFLFLDEGYIFGECGGGFERINLACPAQILEKALERLEMALRKGGIHPGV
ncbi:MAG: pyridoxal phosphate-dependent aminotransferase [Treponema sp.]|jgi:putative C-S lyase|nr:pyridoxal phosphate-dependent aminotransferase [Treponema sp.]